MEIITLVKLPLQLGGQQFSYGGFAGARYTRDHNDHIGSIVACADGRRQLGWGMLGSDTILPQKLAATSKVFVYRYFGQILVGTDMRNAQRPG
jgi:hypothetical protein